MQFAYSYKCREKGVKIRCCVNHHYQRIAIEEDFVKAVRNFRWLVDWGTKDFQIDSEYDNFFMEKL